MEKADKPSLRMHIDILTSLQLILAATLVALAPVFGGPFSSCLSADHPGRPLLLANLLSAILIATEKALKQFDNNASWESVQFSYGSFVFWLLLTLVLFELSIAPLYKPTGVRLMFLLVVGVFLLRPGRWVMADLRHVVSSLRWF